MQQQSLGDILGQALRERDWNGRLTRWSKPASDSEVARIERAATMVRSALAANPWLRDEGVEVIPQGSYHNNTNVRLKADMDLCVRHPSINTVYMDPSMVPADVDRHLGYTPTHSRADISAIMRYEIETALRDQFGMANVKRGGKAFSFSAVPGSRSDIDVVPATRLHAIYPAISLGSYYHVVEGIVLRKTDGGEIYNFPMLHHDNGKAKRQRTGHRFKKIVRQAKMMRDQLVDRGTLKKGQIPSFLVESLVYIVEDHHFLVEEEHQPRLKRIMERMWGRLTEGDATTLCEVNDVKKLFGAHQPWDIEDAKTYVAAAHHWLVS